MKVDTRETIMFLLRHIRDERHDGDNKNEIWVNNVRVMWFSLRFFTSLSDIMNYRYRFTSKKYPIRNLLTDKIS